MLLIRFGPSPTARVYTLQSNADLNSDGWQAVPCHGPRAGTGGPDSISLPQPTDTVRFYRIEVRLFEWMYSDSGCPVDDPNRARNRNRLFGLGVNSSLPFCLIIQDCRPVLSLFFVKSALGGASDEPDKHENDPNKLGLSFVSTIDALYTSSFS